jgi:hypothetical protein
MANRWFFVCGFEMNERATISAKELEAMQRIAADLFRLSSSELDAHVATEALKEICDDSEDYGRKQDPWRGARGRA